MKKFKNLYQKITDLENIKLAHHNARKNKTHRDDVKKVDEDIEGFCKQIQDMLINHTYKLLNILLLSYMNLKKE